MELLLQVLENTVSTDQSELEAAQRFLEQAALSDLPLLLKELSEILKDSTKSLVARMQAGLQLKNLVYSKDPNVRLQHQQRWLQLDEKVRGYIKQNCLDTLGTETMRPSQAAQVISGVACAELPMNLWPELIGILTQNVITNNSTEVMREATLETIGYVCMDIDPMILTAEANNILTAIVFGMKKEEPSDHVRLAATNALLNSLEFTRANFDKDCERHFIMQVVCEATQSPNTHIKVAALQCLVKIMSLYYQYMETYMGPALFAISVEAMKSDVDEVALQGIEFWSNVCDEEVDLAIEASEAAEQGRPPERVSKFYAKGALPFLVPILTLTLAKQEESDDDDEWNPCKAAGVCLMLLATCCEDAIVPHVMPFIREKFQDQDWRMRDAAVMALGCILEGPEQTVFADHMTDVVPAVVTLLQDPSVVVRDTAAWTIGRMCEILPEFIINENCLMPLLDGLLKGLQSVPRVAANVCWAFSSLAEAAYEAAEASDEDAEPATYCLSPVYENIVEQLLATTDRSDSNQQNLRSAAYEAVMELVKNSPKDCYQSVQKTTMIILQRLENVLNMESQITSSSDRAVYNDLQSLLCATLQSVLRKVSREDAPKISDAIMTAILRMFNNTTGTCGGVQEDALLAVSTLVEVLGEGFMKYIDAFKPYLMIGLNNVSEHQVCLAAVGLVGDVCRALSIKVLPICEEIMGVLLNILQDSKVHRSVKPQILSVFGDVALAIGPEFSKCLDVVLNTLYQASKAQVDLSDPDMVDYLNDLRDGCLEAYTGIIQGLKGTGQAPTPEVMRLAPHVPHMVAFIEEIAGDSLKNDSCISSCCGLIGDLCSTFGPQSGSGHQLLQAFENEKVQSLLTMGRRSKATKTKMLATWASKELRKVKSAQS